MGRYLKAIHQLSGDGASEAVPIRVETIHRIVNNKRKSNIWLISFTDLMAVCLTFFVLLFSMSKPHPMVDNDANSPVTSSSINGALTSDANGHIDDLGKAGFNRALDLGYLQNVIFNQVRAHPILNDMQIRDDKNNGRMILILPEHLLFASGSSSLSPNGQRALGELAQILNHIRNGVEVIGHSDPRPAHNGQSNMVLSLARAKMVADALRQAGYARDAAYQGYGSALYQNLPQEWDEARKLQTARRVDIVIHNHDGSRQKRFGIAAP